MSAWLGLCNAGATLLLVQAVAGCSNSGAGPSAGVAPRRGGSDYGVNASPRMYPSSQGFGKGGGVAKIGEPYQVGGRWYFPRAEPDYDRIGVASWYGSDFHGRLTANGEIYDMNALSAAHPTLPLPSYVWVTNLANNRQVLVRVNDRGPYVADRLIDLSYATAEALGLVGHGTGTVRVRYAGPAPLDGNDSRERAVLAAQPWGRSGRRYAMNAPMALQAPVETGSAPYSPPYASSGWTATGYRASLARR